MFAFGESFFRASRRDCIVYHFNVFASVFFPLHVNVDVICQSCCFQGFQRGAHRQLRVKKVSRDMIAVFCDSRDFFGYIPYNIALPVVRVYCDLVVGYNIGAGFIRVDLVASDESARQNKRHCQKGKNNNDSFFVGFHNKPRKNLLQGVKNKQKNITSASPLILRQIYILHPVQRLCNANNAPVTEVKGSLHYAY